MNNGKSKSIVIENGVLIEEPNYDSLNIFSSIPTLKRNERIRYLGVDFESEIVVDRVRVLDGLQKDLGTLVTTPLLKNDQKLNIISQFIWPKLIYPLQCAPIHLLPDAFLTQINRFIRGSVKEILQIPMDTPDAFFYSPRKFRGLGLINVKWEAFLQHINICNKLLHVSDPLLSRARNVSDEKMKCLESLNINETELVHGSSVKQIRNYLREKDFDAWCSLPVKGKGVVLFKDSQISNEWMINKENLSCSQFTNAIKMSTNCAAVKGIKGRSANDSSCRYPACRKIETLPHVLQDCPKNELLRNVRHNHVCELIEKSLIAKGYEVHREVPCISADGKNRRADLVVLDRKNILRKSKQVGFILDPTVRFELNSDQPVLVDDEKKKIYEPCIPYFREKYGVQNWEVLGILVGSRGVLPSFSIKVLERLKIKNRALMVEIVTTVIKDSLFILHHHLYK